MSAKKSEEKEKGKSGKKDSSTGNGFSVILGTKRPVEKEPEHEDAEKKPGTEKVAPVEKPKKPETLGDLLKKRQEAELFLASLEEAHAQSKFPVYTYQRLKKKSEAALRRMDMEIKKMQPSVPVSGKVSIQKTMSAIGMLMEKKMEGLQMGGKMEELGKKMEIMESALKKIPYLKSKLTKLKNELDEYQSVMSRVKSHEKSLAEEVSDIRKSLSALGLEVTQRTKEKEIPIEEIKQSVDSTVKNLSRKVGSISRKLEEMFDALKDRIDQVSVIGESETEGYMNELKKGIEEIRAELPGYMKKEDIEKIVMHPVVEGPGRGEKAAPRPAPRKKDTLDIADLPGLLGKDVTVQCSLSELKKIEKKGTSLYWYSIADKTGKGIMMSCEKIPAKKARISGSVKETKTGSVYIFFKRMA